MRNYYSVFTRSFKQYQPKLGWRERLKRKKRLANKIQNELAPKHAQEAAGFAAEPLKNLKFSFLILAILLIFWFGLMVYLPYFKIKEVQIVGQTRLFDAINLKNTAAQIMNRELIIPKNNYFFVPINTIKTALLNNYPLANVEIKKIFPNKLQILINEEMPAIILNSNERYYFLNSKGMVLKVINETSPSTTAGEPVINSSSTPNVIVLSTSSQPTPNSSTKIISVGPVDQFKQEQFKAIKNRYAGLNIVYKTGNDQYATKGQALDENLLKGIIIANNALAQNRIANVKYVTIYPDRGEARITLDKPWFLMIEPTQDLGQQIINLKLILRDNKPKEYVDVRFMDRVFWK